MSKKVAAMQGQRLHKRDDEDDFLYRVFTTPGAYGSVDGKSWFCCTPNGLSGNLSRHEVQEHEDGTITVSPSILVTSGSNDMPSYHGYLERGTWREC